MSIIIENVKIGDVATFDNPKNLYARWGKVLKVEGDRVQLLYIGWGLIKDIQGVQISILEDR